MLTSELRQDGTCTWLWENNVFKSWYPHSEESDRKKSTSEKLDSGESTSEESGSKGSDPKEFGLEIPGSEESSSEKSKFLWLYGIRM